MGCLGRCNLNAFVQWCSIIVGCFGIAVSIALIITEPSVGGIILCAFTILFSVMIVFSEIYVCGLFKYASFIITFWGKGILYLFIGFFIFSTDLLRLVSAVIFWAMFIVYIIFHCKTKSSSPPLCQKNKKPNFEAKQEDYYENTDVTVKGSDV